MIMVVSLTIALSVIEKYMEGMKRQTDNILSKTP